MEIIKMIIMHKIIHILQKILPKKIFEIISTRRINHFIKEWNDAKESDDRIKIEIEKHIKIINSINIKNDYEKFMMSLKHILLYPTHKGFVTIMSISMNDMDNEFIKFLLCSMCEAISCKGLKSY